MLKTKINKGITLIALIITIIIILILSGIVLACILGNNGLLAMSKRAKQQYQRAQIEEDVLLSINDLKTAYHTGDDVQDGETFYEYLQRKFSDGYTTLAGASITYDSENDIFSYELNGKRTELRIEDVGNENVTVTIGSESNDVEENTDNNTIRIYYNGNCYDEITGGWEYYVNAERKASTAENSNYETSYGKYHITAENLEMQLSPVATNSTGSCNDFRTQKTIDLTNYKSIGILASVSNATDYKKISITNNESFIDTRKCEKTVDLKDNEITYLDVSDVKGNYYIQFGIGSYADNAVAKIQEIWLEKKDANIEILFNNTSIQRNETLTANVKQVCNLANINIKQCKYIFSTESQAYGTEANEWKNAQKFTSSNQNLTFDTSNVGTYYLHVLTVDKRNNKFETISEPVTIFDYLYRDGNDYRQITGGWEYYVNAERKTSTIENSTYDTSYGKYNVTTESLAMQLLPVIANNTGSTNNFRTKNSIDLTNYKKIGISAHVANVTDFKKIGITNNENFIDTRECIKTVDFNENGIAYIDISDITGKYYIQFGIGSYLNNAVANIYKIWLE